jgi:hypothetical protein
MNRRNNRTFLKLEYLEQRDLPSAGIPGTEHFIVSGHQPIAGIHAPQFHTNVVAPSSGQGKGTYTTTPSNPDTGSDYLLTGTGNFLNVTNAKITGSVNSPGNVSQGYAEGTITFTNAKGSVTLALVGPEQTAFPLFPGHFIYTVENGTGAYAHVNGSGTLTLTLHQTAVHGSTSQGTFTLETHVVAPGPVRGKGTYTAAPGNPDTGRDYLLTGTGNFLNVTNARITGSVNSLGNIAQGQASGTVTFTNAKGSVTLALVGPEQTGSSPLPSNFIYTVVKGTGAYAHMNGSGILTLTLHQTGFHDSTSHGTFTLEIDFFQSEASGSIRPS